MHLLNRKEGFVVATKSYPWLKPGIWGAVIGMIGIMVLGFWQFGWVLGSKSDEMARDRANTAVAEALAPVCSAKFFAHSDAPAKLADLKKLTSDYEQRNFVEKGGWAIAAVSDAPNYRLVSECTKRILAGNPAEDDRAEKSATARDLNGTAQGAPWRSLATRGDPLV